MEKIRTVQLESKQPYINGSRYISPEVFRPSLTDAQSWRLIANEPVNKMSRRMITREVSALNWTITQRNPTDSSQESARLYYTDLLKDYRLLASKTLKSICEIPQGGAWEIGWIIPGLYGEGEKGTPAFIEYIDAGTLHPTTNLGRDCSIVMIDPYDSTRKVCYSNKEVLRFLAFPHDEYDKTWWQESPTQASYLAISALARIYTYYLKQLDDTPTSGILDLRDFNEQGALEWAKSFREMVQGIDPIKIPILYEHEEPAVWIPMGRNPTELSIPAQFKLYAEIVAQNYGLSLDDLRIFNEGQSKAGATTSRKITVQSGIGYFAELMRDGIQSLLPEYLTFKFDEVDIEDQRTKAQIKAMNARTIQTFTWMPVRVAAMQAIKDGILTIDMTADQILKERDKEMTVQQTNTDNLKPGQVKPKEGRTIDFLEEDAKLMAARGTRIFAKSAIERAMDFVKDQLLGRDHKEKSGSKLESVFNKLFIRAGDSITEEKIVNILETIHRRNPDLDYMMPDLDKAHLTYIPGLVIEQVEYKDLITNKDILLRDIGNILDLYGMEFPGSLTKIMDEDSLEELITTLKILIEEGMYTTASDIQTTLKAQGRVSSDKISKNISITLLPILILIATYARKVLQVIDEGTKYYMSRLIYNGLLDNMTADQLKEYIVSTLFTPDGSLYEQRIKSIITTETTRSDNMGRIAQMLAVGLKSKMWITARDENVCTICRDNENMGYVPMTHMYQDSYGDFILVPPAHPGTCRCELIVNPDDVANLDKVNLWFGDENNAPSAVNLESYWRY